MKKFLLTSIKVIIYLFLIMIFFAIAYNNKSYMQIILAVLASYVLYGFIFKKGFFDDIWFLVIKLVGLLIVTYFVIHIHVYGMARTIDETISVIIFFAAVYFVIKVLNRVPPGSLSQIIKEQEEREKELKIKEIENDINDLEYKRNRVRTRNTLLDEISGDTLSESKLNRNRKYYDKLSNKIDDLKDKRDELK